MYMFNPRANFLRGVWSTVVNLNTYLLCLGALRAVPVPSAGKNCIQTHIFLVNSASEWVILQVTTPYPAKLPVNSVNSNRCRIHPDPKYEDRIFNLNMRTCANQWKQGNFCKHACSLTIPVFFWFWYMLYSYTSQISTNFKGSVPPKCPRDWDFGRHRCRRTRRPCLGPGLIRSCEGLSHGNPRGLAHTSNATLTLAPRKCGPI